MKENKDYLELTYKSINCFADDGRLDVDELNQLLSVALRDGVIDNNEQRVLENIFNRLTDAELTEEMQQKIKQIRQQFS